MLTTADIGKIYKTPQGRVGELRAITEYGKIQFACLHDKLTKNANSLAGILFFWIEADVLTPHNIEV